MPGLIALIRTVFSLFSQARVCVTQRLGEMAAPLPTPASTGRPSLHSGWQLDRTEAYIWPPLSGFGALGPMASLTPLREAGPSKLPTVSRRGKPHLLPR